MNEFINAIYYPIFSFWIINDILMSLINKQRTIDYLLIYRLKLFLEIYVYKFKINLHKFYFQLKIANEKDRLAINKYEKHYLQKQKFSTMIQKN